jgi:hypothetical protein
MVWTWNLVSFPFIYTRYTGLKTLVEFVVVEFSVLLESNLLLLKIRTN